jgi:hypothetical protein
MDEYEAWERDPRNHIAGAFPTDVLRQIEMLLPTDIRFSAETGCGKSTILFSNRSSHHTTFCLDDRDAGADSSVAFYLDCPITRHERVHPVFGPTLRTLPRHRAFNLYDLVLLDGPHGWPFPEVEYSFLYPHIAPGGLLIVDDCNIPTIGRMADVLAEDAMWQFVTLAGGAAIFRRTEAPLFDPFGDGWWEQRYNRRRVSRRREIYLADIAPTDQITSRKLDAQLCGEAAESDRRTDDPAASP